MLLPGLGYWQIVRVTRRVKTDSIMASSWFMCSTAKKGQADEEWRQTVYVSIFMLVGKERRARGGARQFETSPIHRPRGYFAQWRLMLDPFYLLSSSMPGQLCVGRCQTFYLKHQAPRPLWCSASFIIGIFIIRRRHSGCVSC